MTKDASLRKQRLIEAVWSESERVVQEPKGEERAELPSGQWYTLPLVVDRFNPV